MQLEVLKSKIDASVNFVFKNKESGYYEARYVRRTSDYFVCYLSAQSACKQACRFCHLTATKQVEAKDATNTILYEQADAVLNYYDSLNLPARIINYSWQARGEMLENTTVNWYEAFKMLGYKAEIRNLFPRFCISTILPKSMKEKRLSDVFSMILPDMYYSLYSMDPKFRKKWLPNALPAEEGLDKLKEWQDYSKKIPKLHWAFIKGENDSLESVEKICEAVKARDLRVDINIVKYNPYSAELGEEADECRIHLLKETMERELGGMCGSKIKVVDRVGKDCFASCGMFLPK